MQKVRATKMTVKMPIMQIIGDTIEFVALAAIVILSINSTVCGKKMKCLKMQGEV